MTGPTRTQQIGLVVVLALLALLALVRSFTAS
jgi:hypothetical protein